MGRSGEKGRGLSIKGGEEGMESRSHISAEKTECNMTRLVDRVISLKFSTETQLVSTISQASLFQDFS